MGDLKVLLAGETWTSYGIHIKGTNAYTTAAYDETVPAFRRQMESVGVELTHISNHEASVRFPQRIEDLSAFDVVALSDISADTLLLHPDTFVRSQCTPDRIKMLDRWVREGGGLVMIGGYMSFAGYEGKARYYMTGMQELLPVSMLTHDDRVETPEGSGPIVRDPSHPILDGIPAAWPLFLGYNRLLSKPDDDVVMEVGSDPFLAVGRRERGHVAAFASDLSPHWAPPEFLNWEFYGRFWRQLFDWLAHKS